MRTSGKLGALLLLAIACISATEDITVTVTLDKPAYVAGDTVVTAIEFRIPSGYHLYGNPLGPGIGKPLVLRPHGKSAIVWIGARKTPPEKYQPTIGGWVWAYRRSATFFAAGVVPLHATGPALADTLVLDALICHMACVPIRRTIPLAVPLVESRESGRSFSGRRELADLYDHSEEMPLGRRPTTLLTTGSTQLTGLDPGVITSTGSADGQTTPQWDYEPGETVKQLGPALAVLLAFLAGIILNVMPCVLPVLGIKIISFAQGNEGSRRTALLRGLAFSAGIVTVFLLLASLAAFAGFSWGEQFQNSAMLVGIICVIFVFALGMFDLFTIMVPSGFAKVKGSADGRQGILDDFVKGMFATVLATPCSGPLLGATLAWTLTQSPLVVYVVFAGIGLGMASPYVLLSASPRLARLLPKPGAWMEDFKHVMGFLLLGFAVYLMTGLPTNLVIPTLSLCVFLAFAVVLYGRVAPFGSRGSRKAVAVLAAAPIALAGWYIGFGHTHVALHGRGVAGENRIAWEDFSPRLLTEAHASGRHVVVDFAANWCMNCQYNKVAVLQSREVSELVGRKGILMIEADLTQENPDAESLLHHLGSRSVPFLAIFPGDDPFHPVIMRDVLSRKRVLRALADLVER